MSYICGECEKSFDNPTDKEIMIKGEKFNTLVSPCCGVDEFEESEEGEFFIDDYSNNEELDETELGYILANRDEEDLIEY